MQEDQRKLNSWWQSVLASDYVKTMFFGLVVFVGGIAIPNIPRVGRILFVVFGLVIAVASYFAAKSRWKKI